MEKIIKKFYIKNKNYFEFNFIADLNKIKSNT